MPRANLRNGSARVSCTDPDGFMHWLLRCWRRALRHRRPSRPIPSSSPMGVWWPCMWSSSATSQLSASTWSRRPPVRSIRCGRSGSDKPRRRPTSAACRRAATSPRKCRAPFAQSVRSTRVNRSRCRSQREAIARLQGHPQALGGGTPFCRAGRERALWRNRKQTDRHLSVIVHLAFLAL